MNSDEATVAVIDALQALDIPYILVGSLASNLYGIPRSTKDADFSVQVGAGGIRAIVARLGSQFRLDPQVSFETVMGTMRYVVNVAERQRPSIAKWNVIADNGLDRNVAKCCRC